MVIHAFADGARQGSAAPSSSTRSRHDLDATIPVWGADIARLARTYVAGVRFTFRHI
jgi:hypothetical protein